MPIGNERYDIMWIKKRLLTAVFIRQYRKMSTVAVDWQKKEEV